MHGKALQPLTHGVIVLVGVKASNFDEEIRTHPRIVMWDSQNEHWSNKELPDNTRAVFMTRFISHRTSEKLLTEARKRQITIFNPEGTGMITKQVKELLNLVPADESQKVMPEPSSKNKLTPLIQLIDFSKSNVENAREILMPRAIELGIQTTEASLAQLVTTQRRRLHKTGVPRSIQKKVDVSVEILDGMIQQLKDMREFIIATTDENNSLKDKLAKFKQLFEEK